MNVLRTDLDYKMGEVTLIGGNPYQRDQRMKEQQSHSALGSPHKSSIWNRPGLSTTDIYTLTGVNLTDNGSEYVP